MEIGRCLDKCRAAVKIQGLGRRYLAQNKVIQLRLAWKKEVQIKEEKEREILAFKNTCAVKIQSLFRGFRERFAFCLRLRLHRSAVIIQHAWKLHKSKVLGLLRRAILRKTERVRNIELFSLS